MVIMFFYLFPQSNIKLTSKQYKIYSNKVAVTNELLKTEIIYYGTYKKEVKNNLKKRIN